MGIEMSIASASMQMKSAQLSQNVGTAVTKNAMDVQETLAANLLSMMNQVQGLGQVIDTTA